MGSTALGFAGILGLALSWDTEGVAEGVQFDELSAQVGGGHAACSDLILQQVSTPLGRSAAVQRD